MDMICWMCSLKCNTPQPIPQSQQQELAYIIVYQFSLLMVIHTHAHTHELAALSVSSLHFMSFNFNCLDQLCRIIYVWDGDCDDWQGVNVMFLLILLLLASYLVECQADWKEPPIVHSSIWPAWSDLQNLSWSIEGHIWQLTLPFHSSMLLIEFQSWINQSSIVNRQSSAINHHQLASNLWTCLFHALPLHPIQYHTIESTLVSLSLPFWFEMKLYQYCFAAVAKFIFIMSETIQPPGLRIIHIIHINHINHITPIYFYSLTKLFFFFNTIMYVPEITMITHKMKTSLTNATESISCVSTEFATWYQWDHCWTIIWIDWLTQWWTSHLITSIVGLFEARVAAAPDWLVSYCWFVIELIIDWMSDEWMHWLLSDIDYLFGNLVDM